MEGKIKKLIQAMNEKGIPLPMIRDPKSKGGSLTVTLVTVSAGLCTFTILFMLATIISKLTGSFSINETTLPHLREAFYSSIQFLIVSLGGYLGRKLQRSENGKITLEEENKG